MVDLTFLGVEKKLGIIYVVNGLVGLYFSINLEDIIAQISNNAKTDSSVI